MNINNKEFSEFFPLSPPQNGYSFREGFPIVQFQIANQSKLLDNSLMVGRYGLMVILLYCLQVMNYPLTSKVLSHHPTTGQASH
jgi:hypothetical protein